MYWREPPRLAEHLGWRRHQSQPAGIRRRVTHSIGTTSRMEILARSGHGRRAPGRCRSGRSPRPLHGRRGRRAVRCQPTILDARWGSSIGTGCAHRPGRTATASCPTLLAPIIPDVAPMVATGGRRRGDLLPISSSAACSPPYGPWCPTFDEHPHGRPDAADRQSAHVSRPAGRDRRGLVAQRSRFSTSGAASIASRPDSAAAEFARVASAPVQWVPAATAGCWPVRRASPTSSPPGLAVRRSCPPSRIAGAGSLHATTALHAVD